MAGLNSLLSSTETKATTMPSWFDTAQQQVVNQALQANQAAPAAGQTVGQQAINQLSGPTNAFTTAAGTLQDIASGAANPWITDAAGNVTPNTGTALGGLFAAQNQQLQQLMPNVQAGAQAGNIASGNFGSLRGQTAVNKAMADAQANLTAQQMQAALSNQATGVQAGAQAGNVAEQGLKNLMNVGQYQQALPYANALNLGKTIGTVQAPTTVSSQMQYAPLQQIGALASLLGGSSNAGLLDQIFGSGGQGGLIQTIGDYFKTNPTPGIGQMLDANGNIVSDPTYGAAGSGSSYNPYGNMTADEIANQQQYGV